jgi:N4-gp56 family major capsid protein
VLVNFAEILGEQAGDTFDQLTRDVAATTTNIVYPSTYTGRGDITTSDVLTAKLIYKALRALHNYNAMPIQNNRFIGIMSPYTYYDFRQDTTILNMMLDVEAKEKNNPLISGYIGTFAGIDWYVSTNAKVYEDAGATSNDVHATMIFGRDAIGIAGLGAMMPSSIAVSQFQPNTGKRVSPVKMLITSTDETKDDPLAQRGTIGWKSTYVCKMLNEHFMVKIEHGVSS